MDMVAACRVCPGKRNLSPDSRLAFENDEVTGVVETVGDKVHAGAGVNVARRRGAQPRGAISLAAFRGQRRGFLGKADVSSAVDARPQ
jgi:hypothetical protein